LYELILLSVPGDLWNYFQQHSKIQQPGVFSSISKDEVRIIDVPVTQRLDGGDVDDQRPSASLHARLVSLSPS
jgi:hypothetical protein